MLTITNLNEAAQRQILGQIKELLDIALAGKAYDNFLNGDDKQRRTITRLAADQIRMMNGKDSAKRFSDLTTAFINQQTII